MKKILILVIALTILLPTFAQKKQQNISEFTKGMQKFPGFITFYWDNNSGKIWLEVDKFDYEFLYIESLASGVGSNDLGLDRGKLGAERVVKFVKIGPKILLIQPNYDFRTSNTNPYQKKALEDAFAQSVIWGFKAHISEKNNVLIDATDFILTDARKIQNSLKNRKQGAYKLDKSRSAIYLAGSKNFPKNTEIEALLTYTGNPKGQYIREVVPSPEAVTLRQHHSFVALPDNGYKARKFDPRSGYMSIQYKDYSTLLSADIDKKYIRRHRIEKKDPSAAISEAVEPIVYYVDRGIPEPILAAVIEGANWWKEAFTAAGFKNGFKVELLPEGADPLDVRYNMVQWVNRSNRGWSYGASVTDPRTGEILKGHVSLGSLRVKQDFLIAQSLIQGYKDGTVSEEMKNMALARIRQLSAHEIGHTLGLVHNYSSSKDNRASVMDYPHPLLLLKDGNIDFSNAYASGIGEWDKQAIKYGYTYFPDETDGDKALTNIIDETFEKGLSYFADESARPAGSAHPYSHLWDNGTNSADELLRLLKIRETALKNFGPDNIPTGQDMASLEDLLVPLYLLHRYQIEATVKTIGGLDYNYAIKGDNRPILNFIPKQEQKKALEALLYTIQPEILEVPGHILDMIPPQPPGNRRNRENFAGLTGVSFDAFAPARAVTDFTIKLMLHPERLNRLVQYSARDNKQLSLNEFLDELMDATWKKDYSGEYYRALNRISRNAVLTHLIDLSFNDKVDNQTKSIIHYKLKQLAQWMKAEKSKTKDENQIAFYEFALVNYDRYIDGTYKVKKEKDDIVIPPGSPIGME